MSRIKNLKGKNNWQTGEIRCSYKIPLNLLYTKAIGTMRRRFRGKVAHLYEKQYAIQKVLKFELTPEISVKTRKFEKLFLFFLDFI